MNRSFKSLDDLDLDRGALAEWATKRETDMAVAVAIHGLASGDRDPHAIWADPTPAEFDHVKMAVDEYVRVGDFDAADDGRYCWGEEVLTLP